LCDRVLCLKYEVKRQFGKSPFSNGVKYCNHCGSGLQVGIYMKWDGLFCPCCSFKLRSKPRFKKEPPKHTCFQCSSTISMRGEFPLWFKDKFGNDVCWKCWFKIHKAICIVCGKSGKLMIGGRKFVIKSISEIRCKICSNIDYYQKLRKKQKNIVENAIIPRFH